jgi:bile acid:Na+ symporter, BASS family
MAVDPAALIPFIIAAMMFGFGATTRIDHFRLLTARPLVLLVSLAMPAIAAPLIGLALIQALQLTGDAALGLMLVAVCPTGALTSLWVLIARGDATLPLAVTLITTALASFTTPFWLYIAGVNASVHVEGLALRLVVATAVPLLIGMVLARGSKPLLARF